ncbi:uncharacterized protein KGF55_000379 [Candida pseudojiufengensis]|uniref:uncharacterized protein n=1 Tax=Candida pseudojiufengensis TaxID=497109 RepID=UPI002224038E|nr:uncharacterized protein KGF55_000379 [Candida pseudojiufengensis]KAI5966970.1 hypothetical protein KGF55_000379 [Candida pseudojiufengensis]
MYKTLISKRSLSSLPVNKTLEILKATNSNFEGLFSNNTLNQLWFKQGQQLIENLNQYISQSNLNLNNNNSSSYDLNLKEIIKSSINKSELYQINKNASKLLNLIQFFENIRPANQPIEIIKPTAKDLLKTSSSKFGNIPTDENLLDWLNQSFGSIQEFRNLFLNIGNSIKGDGNIWVVAESTMSKYQKSAASSGVISSLNFNREPSYHNLSIIATYNGGIIDDSERSGQIKRLKDLQKENSSSTEEQNPEQDQKNPLELGSIEDSEFENSYLNKNLIPILNIDVSPKCYLLDYGVFGKKNYLENCWECIDWDIVIKRLPIRSKQAITV